MIGASDRATTRPSTVGSPVGGVPQSAHDSSSFAAGDVV
jgi:hypothetical protein